MKAVSNKTYDVVQLTEEMRTEKDQKTVRRLFRDVTSVEVKTSGLSLSTRNTRYDIPLTHWIMRDQRGGISIVSDVTFQLNYRTID